jgi:UDP-N-acetylglucosamine:LPS N-acetylglucosamine transferase
MGGGHEATADALEAAAARLWEAETCRVDTLDAMGPWVGRLFRRIYVDNVEHTPWLYEFFYANLWRHRWFADASKRFTGSWSGRRLRRAIDRFDPDLLLSTYPLGSSGLAWLRRHRGLSVPTAAYVSDFAPHPVWVHDDLDSTVVAHEEALPLARACAPRARLRACSDLARPGFVPGLRPDARARHGLDPAAFVVLVSCGAYAFGDVVATVRTLLHAHDRVQVVAACGRDEQTASRLRALGMPPGRLRALRWTEDMAGLVQAADLVVANAGGAIALEAIACARPVLMYRPIAAHGRANADLMVVTGLAELCTDEAQLTAYVRSAVADPAPLHDIEHRAAELRDRSSLPETLRELDAGPRPAPHRSWPMRPSDAFFVHVDTPLRRQELGAVVELDRSVDLERARQQLRVRVRGLPPMRRQLVRGRAPAWRSEGGDPGARVSEVVVPEDGVDEAVDRFWSEPMPEGGAAWQLRLVSTGAGGRALFVVKMHHSLGDGVSALGLLDRLLDPAPDDPLVERRPAPRRRRPSALTALGTGRRMATGLVSLAVRGFAPRHPMATRPQTRLRTVARAVVAEQRLRRLCRTTGAHTHEVVLALVGETLARSLAGTGLVDPARPLRVMVPVAVRRPRLDRVFGNWTGAVALDLDLRPAGFPARLEQVQREVRRCSRRGEPQAAHLVMQVMGHLPTPMRGPVARMVYASRFFGAIVSFMPAARGERWFAGARVRSICPVVPLGEGIPLGVGVVVAGDSAAVGFLLDAGLGLDRARLADDLDQVLAEAESEVG